MSNGDEVAGSVLAVDTFLGVLLRLSSNAYDASEAKYDGIVEVEEDATSKRISLVMHGDPDDIDQQKELLLKVTPTRPILKKVAEKRKATEKKSVDKGSH